jgi:hypothetical protein
MACAFESAPATRLRPVLRQIRAEAPVEKVEKTVPTSKFFSGAIEEYQPFED